MVDSDPETAPVQHRDHKVDALALKADKIYPNSPSEKKGPAGGYDETPIPQAPPGYTLKFTFHRAYNLPFADFSTFSSDPYVLAQLNTKMPTRHKQDPKLKFRTPTIRRNTEPEWECEWIVANVPASGFDLKCRIYDEDPADHDDRLGNVHVKVDKVSEDWEGIREKAYSVKKRMGSKRAYLFRGAAALINPEVHLNARLVVSVEVLGRTDCENGGRIYTVGPSHWSRHFSPLFGMLSGTKDPAEIGKDGKPKRQRYNFQANQIQLQGPTPDAMYHRYVEFKPFIKGMFTATSFQGAILNRAMHHQHARIYNYDKTTIYGVIPGPSEALTKQFLELVHWDKGARIFTYVITLDGQMRFTETGKEFSIDMLSKHTLHSDCDNWIAYSGEFFVRRMKHPWSPGRRSRAQTGLSGASSRERSRTPSYYESPMPSPDPRSEEHRRRSQDDPSLQPRSQPQPLSTSAPRARSRPTTSQSRCSMSSRRDPDSPQAEHPPDDVPNGPPSSPPPEDPAYYHLIIDNDSGTYRPNAALLPQLRAFLRHNFPGLRISTLDCVADADKMGKMKSEQRERKKREKGVQAFMQLDSSDEESSTEGWSSSDEEELHRVVRRQGTDGTTESRKSSGIASTLTSPIEKGKEVWRRLKDPKNDGGGLLSPASAEKNRDWEKNKNRTNQQDVRPSTAPGFTSPPPANDGGQEATRNVSVAPITLSSPPPPLKSRNKANANASANNSPSPHPQQSTASSSPKPRHNSIPNAHPATEVDPADITSPSTPSFPHINGANNDDATGTRNKNNSSGTSIEKQAAANRLSAIPSSAVDSAAALSNSLPASPSAPLPNGAPHHVDASGTRLSGDAVRERERRGSPVGIDGMGIGLAKAERCGDEERGLDGRLLLGSAAGAAARDGTGYGLTGKGMNGGENGGGGDVAATAGLLASLDRTHEEMPKPVTRVSTVSGLSLGVVESVK